jgi:hypothetical protein
LVSNYTTLQPERQWLRGSGFAICAAMLTPGTTVIKPGTEKSATNTRLSIAYQQHAIIT